LKRRFIPQDRGRRGMKGESGSKKKGKSERRCGHRVKKEKNARSAGPAKKFGEVRVNHISQEAFLKSPGEGKR